VIRDRGEGTVCIGEQEMTSRPELAIRPRVLPRQRATGGADVDDLDAVELHREVAPVVDLEPFV
jgi:hypothetical protein